MHLNVRTCAKYVSCDDIDPFQRIVICGPCRESPQETAAALQWMRRGVEKRARAVQEICASCSSVGVAEDIECESLDCGWLFERQKAFREQQALCGLSDVVDGLG